MAISLILYYVWWSRPRALWLGHVQWRGHKRNYNWQSGYNRHCQEWESLRSSEIRTFCHKNRRKEEGCSTQEAEGLHSREIKALCRKSCQQEEGGSIQETQKSNHDGCGNGGILQKVVQGLSAVPTCITTVTTVLRWSDQWISVWTLW